MQKTRKSAKYKACKIEVHTVYSEMYVAIYSIMRLPLCHIYVCEATCGSVPYFSETHLRSHLWASHGWPLQRGGCSVKVD